jgi:hypothetical protein
VIDGPVEVLWDCGAGCIGLTAASLCPDQCPLLADERKSLNWRHPTIRHFPVCRSSSRVHLWLRRVGKVSGSTTGG